MEAPKRMTANSSDRLMFGLISDTHSHTDPDAWAEAFHGATAIFHAGDIGHQNVLDTLNEIAPTIAVKGNIDGGDLRFLPEVEQRTFARKKIVMLHIAGSPKRPNKHTRRLLVHEQPDILLVGHSHIPTVQRVDHGCLWINPGAAGTHGFHPERVAMRLFINTFNGELSLERVCFGPRVPQQPHK